MSGVYTAHKPVISRLAPQELQRVACRFVAALLVLMLVAARYETELVSPLLPALKAEIAWLDDTYQLISLDLQQQGGDSVIRLQVSQAKSIVIGERVFLPDARGRARASTLLAHITLPMVLMLACACAWPLGHKPQTLTDAITAIKAIWLRTVAITLACALMLLIDVPFELWAAIWSLHVNAVQPDLFSPLLIWRDVMGGGGRLALGLGFGCAAVGLSTG